MGFKKFSILIAIRTVMVMATLILLAFLVNLNGYYASTFLVVMLLSLQCVLLYRFVVKTNNELTRFFEAARYADYSQRFEFQGIGAGFAELGDTFTDILKRFQDNRADQEQQNKHFKAVIEHVPVPLISIHFDGKIKLWNNGARRLFGANKVAHLDDLLQFGDDFIAQLQSLNPGERKLVTFEVDGMEHRLVVLATQLIIAGQQEKLLSLQDIQSELDGVQLQAWQDLVRVLTHEIMNSITPVASLAKTAVDLLDDAKSKFAGSAEIAEELNDAFDAVQTVARRSDGLMNFVGSYRQLTRLPAPNKKVIKLERLFSQVIAIATSHWQEEKIELSQKIEPSGLEITVDVDMIEQILINLLQNAEQALLSSKSPQESSTSSLVTFKPLKVSMFANLNRRGHVVVDIMDNGVGVPDELSKKIFVPFFTTKREGSGVGLALTRQVMIAHGGNVKLLSSPSGGACFRLTF